MLDAFFFSVLHWLVVNDHALMLLLGLGCSIPLFIFLCNALPIVEETLLFLLVLVILTFIPVTAFPHLLDWVYVKSKLLSPVFIETIPEFYRILVEWPFALLSVVGLRFMYQFIYNLKNGIPFTASKFREWDEKRVEDLLKSAKT